MSSSCPDSSSQAIDPTDLRVGVREEAGERLHVAGVDPLRGRSDSESHAGTHSGRGDRSVLRRQEAELDLAGAARASRHASQPPSNCPR